MIVKLTVVPKSHKHWLDVWGEAHIVRCNSSPFSLSNAEALLLSRIELGSCYICIIDYWRKVRRMVEQNMKLPWTPLLEGRRTRGTMLTFALKNMLCEFQDLYLWLHEGRKSHSWQIQYKEGFRAILSTSQLALWCAQNRHTFISWGYDLRILILTALLW